MQKKELTKQNARIIFIAKRSTTFAIEQTGLNQTEDNIMELKDLCTELSLAKGRLSAIQSHILKLENDIIAMLPPKLEGSQTIPVPGWKLTTTHKLTRKLDYDAYQALDLPESMQFVNLKPAIDLFKLRAIERLDPTLVSKCVTIKPAKTAVKVEEVEG